MSIDDKITEQYVDPTLARTHGQPAAVVSWTDAQGTHEVTISSPVTVGKSPAANIVLSDPSVSSVHLELVPTSKGVMVRDLQSTNGTHTETMDIQLATIRGAFNLRLGRAEIHVRPAGAQVEARLWPSPHFGNLLGQSVAMRALFEQLANVAMSDETVLLHGETGTGKELVAAAIHEHSSRPMGPYVVVDCGVLHRNLAESELFGHVKGAFSGADRDREGAFEAADGGTLFLDEIGELPLEMQSRLLRALESREIRRVGETEYRSVNVRVIAASFRDLRELVNQRVFREDLYYRLAVVPLKVPPLRDRTDDIPMLVRQFVSAKSGAVMPGDDVMKRLQDHSWPGNVRELSNLVGRASVLGWDAALADGIAGPGVADAPRPATESKGEVELRYTGGTLQEARQRWVEQAERVYIEGLLKRFGKNMVGASTSAGVDPSTLRRIIRKLKAE